MHPQVLQPWPQGRQALAIRAHNLFQNNGKRNLFSQNWSDNDAKKNRLQDFYDIIYLHMQETGWPKLVDLMKCASKIYFENLSRSKMSPRQVLD